MKNRSGQVTVGIAIVLGVVVFAGILALFFLTAKVPTGHVGVITNFGKVSGEVLGEGFHFVGPTDSVNDFSVMTISWTYKTDCFSKDLQLVNMEVTVQGRVLKENAAKIFQTYGEDYMQQAFPKISEVLKSETAKFEASELVAKREPIRAQVIQDAQARLAGFIELVDFSIVNISFSEEYEKAIEAKQVAQQLAQQAVYELQRAKVEADKKIAQAEGEAKAIQIRGEALAKNPGVVSLELIQKWDGKSPTTLVVGDGKGANIVLPISR